MKKCILMGALLAAGGVAQATVVDFNSKGPVPGGYYAPGTGGTVDWQDGGVTFGMTEDLAYGYYWEGFVYSDVNAPLVPGFGNQYAVYGDGMDRSDGGVYAVGYNGYYGPTTLSLGAVSYVDSLYVNNSAYTALDMISGSGYSKAFTTNDWLKLTVEGFNGASSQGTAEIYLADFTGYSEGDDKNNYMLTDWATMDLSGLGSNVTSLAFTLSSSDTGTFGMNTPAYFAIDDLTYETVPEPGTVALMLVGFGGLAVFRKKRHYFFR